MNSSKFKNGKGLGPSLHRWLFQNNALVWQYRKLSWQSRSEPDFLIIGSQRSGTTSLHAYLKQHPQIIPAIKKEIHFFDGGLFPDEDTYSKGESWYRAHFPKLKTIRKDQQVFEASPLYIFNPLAPQRIAELIPKVKMIAILRNPTERALSHYFHEKWRGRESLEILDSFYAEEHRLETIIKNKDYKNLDFISFSYKSRGRYWEQLSRYFEFFPSEQILILKSEDFFLDTHSTLRKIFHFIGINPEYHISDLNPRGRPRNQTHVDAEVTDYLNEYFRPHNHALYQLIGQDFGWDKPR
jgi:hypothetical protein